MADGNRIRYDRRLYEALFAMICETGRFRIREPGKKLIDLSSNSASQLEELAKKQVNEEIPLWSHERFEQRDFDLIFNLLAPEVVDAYWKTHGRANMGLRTLSHTLDIRFYNLSD